LIFLFKFELKKLKIILPVAQAGFGTTVYESIDILARTDGVTGRAPIGKWLHSQLGWSNSVERRRQLCSLRASL
jgi:hypothetical protein